MLEYDDARSGSFDALRDVPDDKTVVLGLITTKRPRLETLEALKRRVDEAARFMPLERLAISPQCGFSTSIVGNRISIENEKRKLGILAEAAEAIWG